MEDERDDSTDLVLTGLGGGPRRDLWWEADALDSLGVVDVIQNTLGLRTISIPLRLRRLDRGRMGNDENSVAPGEESDLALHIEVEWLGGGYHELPIGAPNGKNAEAECVALGQQRKRLRLAGGEICHFQVEGLGHRNRDIVLGDAQEVGNPWPRLSYGGISREPATCRVTHLRPVHGQHEPMDSCVAFAHRRLLIDRKCRAISTP